MRSVRTWFHDTTGGLPRAFWYLWAGTLVNRLGSFVVIFLAIYLTKERGLQPAAAGFVIGLGGAGGAIGTMAGGVLADRWGRRPTLLLAHIGAAAALVGLGFARTYVAIAAGALLVGVFAEMVRPAFAAMMVDIVPERDRLRAFSLNYWAINLGFAFSSVLAGLAAQVNFLLLFVVNAGATLLTAGIVLFKVRETRPVAATTVTSERGTPPAASLRLVFADRVFLAYVGLNVLTALIFLQHISSLPIAMGQDGLSPATFGAVIALNGVLIVAGQLFVPRIIRSRSRSHTLAVAAIVIGAGFGLTAVADTAALYAVTVLIWTLGEMLNSPSNATLMAELSPALMRGRYQGVFSLSWSVAAFIAPVAGGWIQQHVGNAALWLGCAGLAVLVAGGHLLSGPARERRAAALRSAAAAPPTAGQAAAGGTVATPADAAPVDSAVSAPA